MSLSEAAERRKEFEAAEKAMLEQKAEGEEITPEPESVPGKENPEIKPESDNENDSETVVETPESETDSPIDQEEPEAPESKVEAPEDETTPGEQDDTVIDQLSEKAQRRFKKQNAEKKAAQEERDRLREENEELKKQTKQTETVVPQPPPVDTSNLPWDLPADDDGNIILTPEGLSEIIQKESRKVVNDVIKARDTKAKGESVVSELQSDIAQAEQQWPELKEESPTFNEGLATTVAKLYELAFKGDNSIRFIDFVNDYMSVKQAGYEEGRKEAAKKRNAKKAAQIVTTKNRPTDSKDQSVVEQIDSVSSIEDLERLGASL